jgi:hypothetical protein
MRKALLAASLISCALFVFGTEATACGDKFLALGRGVRFQRQLRDARPANILIYSSSRMPASGGQRLQSYLKRLGHRPDVLVNPGELNQGLQMKRYDVILADITDAGNLQGQLAALSSKPVVFPLLYNLSKTEEAAVAQQYRFVITRSTKIEDFLLALYQVTNSKPVTGQRGD